METWREGWAFGGSGKGCDPWPWDVGAHVFSSLGQVCAAQRLGRGICGYIVRVDGILMQVGAVVTYRSDALASVRQVL